MRSNGRVLMAMSGGVDSSVAAGLLVREGYEVIGATMNVWPRVVEDGQVERDQACCSLSSVEDARRVARALGIPHYVLNYRDAFEEHVIRNFCEEYRRGRTPNPCIRCNQFLKYGELLRRASELEADYVATGHYARVGQEPSSGRWLLRKGLDAGKDQSYVLYVLTQAQLARALFPLGELSKEETRRLAAEWGLPVAAKPDSQEVCFIPSDDYVDFLEDYLGGAGRPGPIENSRGEILGTHRGLLRYTVGQRKGIGLAGPRPLYVLELDPGRNAVVVGEADELLRPAALVEQVNWISVPGLVLGMKVTAKIRYRSVEAAAQLFPDGDKVLVRFSHPQRAIAPGQAIVFYEGDLVVGGGIITMSLPGERAACGLVHISRQCSRL